MAWLIGIICLVIVAYNWKVFLPLVVVVGIILGVVILNENSEREERNKKKVKAELDIRNKITAAQSKATSEDKKWFVLGESDPASDARFARIASITSNDGLCYLTVEKRIDGSELTGLKCSGIKISEYDDIYIKFDTHKTSKKMDIKSYSNSDDVYIPSYQADFSGYYKYKSFIHGLVTAKSVAIKIPAVDGFWVRFSLKGSTAAINKLGKRMN